MSVTRVTIITVCRNAAKTLERTISSVRQQRYTHIDYVIVDGGSSDGTTEIIERNKDVISTYVSENDEGVYHAMNKGIKLARGDILFFLNADDRFPDEQVIADIVSIFDGYEELDVVYGDVVMEWTSEAIVWRQPETISRMNLAYSTVCHQSMFTRRDVFSRYGGFDQSLKIVADYEWLMRIYSQGARFRHVKRIITLMGTTGLSHVTSYKEEKDRIMGRYYRPYEVLFWRTLPRKLPPKVRRILGRTLSYLRRHERDMG